MSRRKAARLQFLCIWLGLAAAFLFAGAGSVSAAEFGNIGGQPANPDPKVPRSKSIFIHTITPGQTVKDAVKVVNYTTETKTLEIYATDSLVSSGGAFGCTQKAEAKRDVGSWINLSAKEVTLQPRTEKIVPFTVTAPATANAGGNDGCIVIQEKDGAVQKLKQTGGGSVALNFRTAIRVALVVPGDIVKKLAIVDYKAIKQPNGNFILQPKIKNDGNVSVDATVASDTKDIFGRQQVRSRHEFPILRGSTTDWNIEYKQPFWGGLISSKFVASYDTNVNNELGVQTNKDISTLESKTIRFFSFPKPAALVIELLVLLAPLALALYIRRQIQQRLWVSSQWVGYTVGSRDNINSLARRYGVSWKLLAKTNKLKPPYTLREGDKIKVPPPRYTKYKR